MRASGKGATREVWRSRKSLAGPLGCTLRQRSPGDPSRGRFHHETFPGSRSLPPPPCVQPEMYTCPELTVRMQSGWHPVLGGSQET